MGKPKNQKEKLSEVITIRVSPFEKNFIKGLADMYSQGNLSLWMTYAALNAERKFLKEDDLIESNRRIRKGRGGLAPPVRME